MSTLDFSFAPNERSGVLAVGGGEIADRLNEVLGAAETRVAQRLALEDSEPYLNLVEPVGACRREVEGNVGMCCEPIIIFLVGAQVIENDMNVALGREIGNHFIHEGLKVSTLLGLCRFVADSARRHLQSGKEVDCVLIRLAHPARRNPTLWSNR